MSEFKYIGNEDSLFMTEEQQSNLIKIEIAYQLKRIADQMRK